MYFYRVKCGKLVGWVSLSATYDGPIFTLHNSYYNYFKDKFFKLKSHSKYAKKRLLFHPDLTPRFPLYWKIHEKFKSRVEYLFTIDEREAKTLIRKLPRPISSRALLSVPSVEDPDALFLGMICPLCLEL